MKMLGNFEPNKKSPIYSELVEKLELMSVEDIPNYSGISNVELYREFALIIMQYLIENYKKYEVFPLKFFYANDFNDKIECNEIDVYSSYFDQTSLLYYIEEVKDWVRDNMPQCVIYPSSIVESDTGIEKIGVWLNTSCGKKQILEASITDGIVGDVKLINRKSSHGKQDFFNNDVVYEKLYASMNSSEWQ
jgi:hypothetical protein